MLPPVRRPNDMIFFDLYPVCYAFVIFASFETTVAGEAHAVVARFNGQSPLRKHALDKVF